MRRLQRHAAADGKGSGQHNPGPGERPPQTPRKDRFQRGLFKKIVERCAVQCNRELQPCRRPIGHLRTSYECSTLRVGKEEYSGIGPPKRQRRIKPDP